MAISLDSAPATRGLATSANTLTYAFTRASGIGQLFVGVGTTETSGNAITVTYGGESMTQLDIGTMGGVVRYALYRLRNPSSSGANNVVVTIVGAVAAFTIVSNVISLLGDTTTTINSNKQTGSSVTSLSNTLSLGDQSWMVLVGGSVTVDLTGGTNVTNNSTSNPLMGWFGPKSGRAISR